MVERSPRQQAGNPKGGSSRTVNSQQPQAGLQKPEAAVEDPAGAGHRRDPQSLATWLWELEQRVRNDLAEHLRRCPYLPPTLATTLANDVEQSVTPHGLGCGAPDNGILAEFLRDLETNGSGSDTTIDHTYVPLHVTDRLIADLSASLRDGLIERHGLPSELADEIVMHGRERTLSRAITAAGPAAEVGLLVVGLSARHALTPTLLLRGLCLGRLHFFASALAALADVPVAEAEALIFGGSATDLLQLYEKSGLPLDLFRAFRTTIEMIDGLEPEQIESWQREYTNLIIARLVNEYDHVCPEDLEHVMSQLTRRMTEETGSSSLSRAQGSADV